MKKLNIEIPEANGTIAYGSEECRNASQEFVREVCESLRKAGGQGGRLLRADTEQKEILGITIAGIDIGIDFCPVLGVLSLTQNGKRTDTKEICHFLGIDEDATSNL